MRSTRSIGILAIVVFFLGHISASFAEADDQQDLVEQSKLTLDSFARDSEMDAMRKLIKVAKGVVVVPELVKGGFIIGASAGTGLLTVVDEKSGEWSAPSFLIMGSGSIGFQIGAEAQEIVLVIMTDKGLESVVQQNFELGANASLQVGPKGKGVEASTRADIYSFVRSAGLFGGVSVGGAAIEADDKANILYYGKKVGPREIVIDRTVDNKASDPLKASLKAIRDSK